MPDMIHATEARILDANANRAREGLRVAEEYARFVLDRSDLCEHLKRLRHDLTTGLTILQNALPSQAPFDAFRDTIGDVGTQVTTQTESIRHNAQDVAKASMKRLQEALRTLEEYGKLFSPSAAASLEQIRYASYTAESLLFAAPDRKARLRDSLLYVLVTESLASASAEDVTREAIAGGADIIQMREKEMEDKAFLDRSERLAAICREGGALFILNDRPHICTLVDADGIHTGQGDLPVHLSRRIIGYDRIIGRSTSAPDIAESAFRDGADYIGVGPVYETKTKEHRAPVGLEYVTHIAQHGTLPYFCIGSINRSTVDAVLDAGARAVAVCTAIIAAKDIAEETAWFRQRITERHSNAS